MSAENGPSSISDGIIDRFMFRWSISPIFLWVISSCIPLVLFGVLSVFTGNFFSSPKSIGFLHNYNFFHNVLLGVPTVVTFYCLLPRFITECFLSLDRNGVIGDPLKREPYGKFLERAYSSISSKRLTVASFILSIVFVVIAVPQHLKGRDWIVHSAIPFVLVELMWLFVFGLTILLSLRIIVSTMWINRAFRSFQINVRPLFPDKSGGLQPLSDFSMRIGYMLFFFGLELGANNFFTGYVRSGSLGSMDWSIDTVLPWIPYLIVAPIVFFAPLGAAHDAMKEAKEKELLMLANQFDVDYKSLKNVIHADGDSIAQAKKKLDQLQKLHRMVSAFPVWPFQAQKLWQFALTVLLPLFLTLMTSIINELVSKML